MQDFFNKLICAVIGHHPIYLSAQYKGEIDGWFCERCNYTHVDKQY